MKNYRKFVDTMIEEYKTKWAGVILKDGTVAAYNSLDDDCREKCLRSARSFYWTVMSMGEMLDLPNLEGRYLEIIWKQGDSHIYVYIFVFSGETVIISTDKKIEDYFAKLMGRISEYVNITNLPGLVVFFTADYDGHIENSFTNDKKIDYLSNKAKVLFEKEANVMFKMYAEWNRSGLGHGKYMEFILENMSIWLFPYKEGMALAAFETNKVETMFNIINHLLEFSTKR